MTTTNAVPQRAGGLRLPQQDGSAWSLVAIVLCASIIILALPAMLLWLSFREAHPIEPVSAYSLLHYWDVFSDPVLPQVLLNTIIFSTTATLISFVVGLPTAWLAVRSDLPGKTLLFTLMTVGLLMPGFATAMGWLMLMHPRIGLINQLLMDVGGLSAAPFNITSVVGMGWVQGLSLAPVAFIMNVAVLRAIDPSLEESAHMSGASFRNILLRVTLPLAWPGILAAGIYVFTIGFAAFDVPAIIGWSNRIYTFATYLFVQLTPSQDIPRYGAVAALSSIVIILAGLLSWWYGRLQKQAFRYQVVTGKGYRPRVVQLGRYSLLAWVFLGFYFVLDKLLPLLVVIWAALLPYFQAPSAAALSSVSLAQFENIPWSLMLDAMKNTGLLMLLTPTITILLAISFSWVVLRSKIPGRAGFDFVAFLPHAVPNILFGVAVLLLAISIGKGALVGTIWILLIAFVVARLSYATRMTNGALIQIHKELEEAATMCGVSTGTTLRRIIIPLLGPALIYAWLWIALMTFRELTLAVILTGPANLTMPVLVWSVLASNGFGGASAVTLILLATMIPFVGLYWWFVRRRGLLGET